DTRAAATRARQRAISFITHHQSRDGGLPASPGDASNAQSTAWAIQGLIAAGRAPESLHRDGAPSPLAYLRSLIAPDGHIRYSRGTDQTPVWVTGEAALALAERPLPLPPLGRAPTAATRRAAPVHRPSAARAGARAAAAV